MSRLRFGSVAIALLVILAGCSAVSPGGNGTTATDVSVENAEPYVSSGEDLNATKLVSTHESALMKSGSFTLRQSTTITKKGNSSRSLSMDGVTKIDLDSKAYLQTKNTSFGNVEKYTDVAAGKTYVKFTMGNKSNVQTIPRDSKKWEKSAVSPQKAVSASMFDQSLGNINYTVEGVTTYNGTTVTRLTANGTDAYPELQERLAENKTVESFESTLLVANGKEYVRYFSMTVEIKDANSNSTMVATITKSYSGLGSTSVEEPAWVSEKKQNATETSN